MAIHLVRPLAVGLLAAFFSAVSAGGQDLDNKVDEYLQAQIRVNQFSGAVLIARDGKILVSKGYGMANRELGVPNTPRTEFRLASITKSFTAIAIMLLQQRGRLDVQDLLSKYYPNCPEAWKSITLHHLLTHTSGIPEYVNAAWEKIKGRKMTKEEVIGLFRDRPLDFAAGDHYHYSNSGYFLLGCVIEKASGQTYEDFLRDNIFSPLQMADTGCNRIEAIIPRRASGYSKTAQGVWENAPVMDMSQAFSAGCVYSTIEDMYRLEGALHAETLLSHQSLAVMFTPFTAHYGYGWDILSHFNRRLISHYGKNDGYSAAFERYPDDGVCIIVLSNQDFRLASTIARDLGAIIFGEKYDLPKEHRAISVDPQLYERYVGTYRIGPKSTVKIWRDGNRLMQETPTGAVFEFIPESETAFFSKFVDASFNFVVNERGEATELVIREGGGDGAVFLRVK